MFVEFMRCYRHSLSKAMLLVECLPFTPLVHPREKVRDPAQSRLANGKPTVILSEHLGFA
jgi:hypothetical protein